MPSSCKFKLANVEHRSTGAITATGANWPVTVNFASQTASVTQAKTPETVQIKHVTIKPKIAVNERTNNLGNSNNAGNIGPSVPPTAQMDDSIRIKGLC